MRILYVTSWLPAPPFDGIRTRRLQQLRALRSRHAIAVLGREMRGGDAAWLETHLPDVRVVALENGGESTAVAIRQVVAREPFDVVHISGISQWPGRRGLEFTPIVLDMDNIESRVLNALRLAGRTDISLLDIESVRALERHALAQVDRVLCCSFDDARVIERIAPKANVHVVPNAIDIDAFAPAPVGPVDGPARLTFTGALAYGPNTDACQWFVREILPRIRQHGVDVRFRMVGRVPPASLVALTEEDGVELAADVPDIRPHLETADVVVVPLRAGSGTRLKILEAFAAGRPVVSTQLGCEGLAVEDGVHLVVADDAERFAFATVQLIRNRDFAARLAAAARTFVSSRFDQSTVTEALLSIYDGLRPETSLAFGPQEVRG